MIVKFEIKSRFDNRARNPFVAEVSMILDCDNLPDWFFSDSELMGEKMTGFWGGSVEGKRTSKIEVSYLSLGCLNSAVLDLMEDSLNLLKETKKQREAEIALITPFKKSTHRI